MTIATGSSFEFIRSVSSPPALLSGDIETGTFIYTFSGTNIISPPLDNFIGSRTDVIFPNTVTAASYTYRAINENQGVLTLTGSGGFNLPLTGRFGAGNASFMDLFESSSTGEDSNQLELDISFSSDGSFVDPGTATMTMLGSTSPFDRVRAPLKIRLKDGRQVPENYNPNIDPNRPSLITPVSLDDSIITFTNTGLGDPSFDFTLQFVADAVGLPGNPPTEVGTALQRIAGSPVDDAVDYTWKRTLGTDSGTLVVSGGGNTFDGIYTLNFAGVDNGTYVGEADADTVDENEVIGTFLLD